MFRQYLSTTPLLDFSNPAIQALVKENGWATLSTDLRIGAVYDFVRNEILFGFNARDTLTASQVLEEGYGHCNTKTTLLMALLRAVDVPCRFHGFTIAHRVQRGIIPDVVYPVVSKNLLHGWAEVFFEGQWIELEGFVLDYEILNALQDAFPDTERLCAYGVGTDRLHDPQVVWRGANTHIQRTGINNDLGVFDAPDAFFQYHSQMTGWRGLMYRNFLRHWMNHRVSRLRKGDVPKTLCRQENMRLAVETPEFLLRKPSL